MNAQSELNVGDSLFVHKKGRVSIDPLQEVKIVKVGRIYYELDHYQFKKVNKSDLRFDDPVYSQNSFQAFRTLEDYNRRIELSNKRADIGNIIIKYNGKLSDEDIDSIHNIISKYL